MGNIRKNQFHIYKATFDKFEEEIQKNNRIEPLYPTGLNVQVRPKQRSQGIQPLYPAGLEINRGNSFQLADTEPRIKIIQMPGIRKGAIKMPLETIARLIEEKLLEYSGNYNPATGSALQLQDVSEDGTFTFTEFYMGERAEKMGGWVEKDGSIKIIIGGKQIN